MAAAQEGDPARPPRDPAQEGEPARPPRDVSLLKVVLEMRKEKLIVPSRHIMRIVQEEERLVRTRAMAEDEGHAYVSAALSPVKTPLLTQLVEQILEYCRLKLLDNDEDFRDVDDKASRVSIGEDEREQRLMVLLRRCTETYGQLLLRNSEFKPSFSSRGRHKSAVEANTEDMRKRGEDSGEEGERTHRPRAERQEDTPPRSARDKIANLSPGASGRYKDSLAHHPTPFYETVYALVTRAVQQGMRAAAEGSKLSQEKGAFAQLAARVEKELACLFRSPQFGRNSGRGLLKGGAKVDVSGGGEGIESAQLAARAEAKLNSMIKEAEKLTALCKTSHFDQLEGRLQRHAQAEAKQITDQAERNPTGGLDSKEALTVSGDHGTSESVDALIAGFWARAIPKQKDQAISLQTVVSTRSPMISSLLPSPRSQAWGMKQKQLAWNLKRKDGLRQQRSGNDDFGGNILPPLDSGGESTASLPLRNAWAFSEERILHAEVKPPPPVPHILTNRIAPLIV